MSSKEPTSAKRETLHFQEAIEGCVPFFPVKPKSSPRVFVRGGGTDLHDFIALGVACVSVKGQLWGRGNKGPWFWGQQSISQCISNTNFQPH